MGDNAIYASKNNISAGDNASSASKHLISVGDNAISSSTSASKENIFMKDNDNIAPKSNNFKGINADIALKTFISKREYADFTQMNIHQILFDNKTSNSIKGTGTGEEHGRGLTNCLRSSLFRLDLISASKIIRMNLQF